MQWVKTKLQAGDALGGSDPAHSLSKIYGVSARDIVERNGVAWNKAAIDTWVMSTGGKRLPFVPSSPYDAARQLGWAVFTENSVILLPAEPPARDVVDDGTEAVDVGLSGRGWLAIGAVVVAGIISMLGGGSD